MVKQVVIMAGGKGTRLRPLTYDIPKPMVPVKGKPFLEYQVELLKKYGFSEFLFCTGYLSKYIEDYFQHGVGRDIHIQYSVEPEPLGTGGALKWAEPKLEDEFILLNGDTLLYVDYRDLVNRFAQDQAQGYCVVYSNEDQIAPNNIRLDQDNWIVEYDKTNPENMQYVDAGGQVFKKNILDYISPGKVVSLEQEIFPTLIQNHQFKAYITHERYYDMGTPERLSLLERVLP